MSRDTLLTNFSQLVLQFDNLTIHYMHTLMVHGAKKKQHAYACVSSCLCEHYSESMADLKFTDATTIYATLEDIV